MTFKKVIVSLLALLVLVGLSACGGSKTSDNTTNTTSNSQASRQQSDYQKFVAGERDIRNHYEYAGDQLLLSQTSTVVLYSALGVDSPEAAQAHHEQNGATKWDGIEGIEHKIDYQTDRLIEETTIDYTKVDLQANAELLQIQLTDGKAPDQISYSQTIQALLAGGYTEVKDGKFQELN
ncbi:DUF1307 domain-containing protein [Streptococcus dentasini]